MPQFQVEIMKDSYTKQWALVADDGSSYRLFPSRAKAINCFIRELFTKKPGSRFTLTATWTEEKRNE